MTMRSHQPRDGFGNLEIKRYLECMVYSDESGHAPEDIWLIGWGEADGYDLF